MTSFSEYKKSLEDILQNVSFLYSGDIISSYDKSLSLELKHKSFSPELIKLMLLDIYNESISYMMSKSNDVSLSSESIKNIYEILQIVNNPNFIFYSNNSKMNLKLSDSDFSEVNSFLPNFFYDRIKLLNNITGFFSPNIIDNLDDSHLIVTDRPIQSLVWSLQNMSYEISGDGDFYQHKVNYQIYQCDFNSTTVHIKNINKIRDEKLTRILNED